MLSFTLSILKGVIKSSNGSIWGVLWICCILPITLIYIRICSRRRRHVAHHPPKAELGLQVLYDCADAKVDIVAVHGLGANPDYAWVWLPKNNRTNSHGYPDRPFNWLKELLPDEMAKDEQSCRVLTYNYDSAWIADAPQQRLSNISDILLETLRNIRDKGQTKWRPLIFIGHSFGGNVIEQAIVSATRNGSEYLAIAESTVGAIFLGTPHRGSPAAAWGALIASLARPGFVTEDRLLKALEQHSDSLSDRLRDFSRWLFLESVSVVCAFEMLPTNYSSRVGFAVKLLPSQIIVPELSACIDGHSGVSLHSDHLKLNKFYGRDDPSFKIIYPRIEKMARGADDTIHRRRNPQVVPTDESSTRGNLQKCLRAMRVANPVDVLAQIQEQKGQRAGRTCEWILEKEEFTRWTTIDAPQLLRLIGSPGIGKTMMSTFLVERIKDKVEKTSKSSFVYFFCDDKEQDRKTPAAILRSLMWQLLLQRNVLFQRHVQPDFEKHEENRVFDDLFNKFHPLWRMFKAMIQDEHTGEVFILIDALDECEKTTRQILLRSIANLIQSSSTLKPACFKFLITSRPSIGDIEFELKRVGGQLRMDSGLINGDLSEYITTKVDELSYKNNYPEQVKNQVQEVLTREAGGTFLWVSLMVAELSRPGVLMSHLETMFQNIPHGLGETYAAILENVSAENREPAQFILRCMVAAYRPLRKSEIQAAYATWKSRSLQRGEDLEIYSDILSSCSSILLVGGEEDATLNFCHQSVKDFLVRENSATTTWYQSTTSEAHLRIFEACWVYLSADEFDKRELLAHLDRTCVWLSLRTRDQFPLHPFLKYASERWRRHALASCAALLHGSHELPIDVAQAPKLRDAWLLGTAAEGQATITDLLLKNGADIEAIDNLSQTPLFKAAEFGKDTIAELLLKNGADIEAKDDLSQTPLFIATQDGQEAIAELLLKNGADIEAKDDLSQTPLFMAARSGKEAITELLLKKGANVEAKNISGETPLFEAIRSGGEAIAELLLEKGADIEAKDDLSQTPLFMAARSGKEAITELLLKKGANVEAKNISGETPLFEAIRSGGEAIARLLLKNGADVEAKNSKGQTPLFVVAGAREDAFARLLLNHGAKVEVEDDYGNTSISNALYDERGHMVAALLEHGANGNVTDNDGRSPLFWAAENGHLDIVKLLLKRDDIDINAKDSYFGQTALSLAAENGHPDIVAALLSREGIEANLKDTYYGRTPLSVAAENGQLNVVKLLLEAAEIDANSADTYFRRTPLWCAIQYGHKEVAELLAVKNGIEYNSRCEVALMPSSRDGTDISTQVVERGKLTMKIVSYDGGIYNDDTDNGNLPNIRRRNDPNNILGGGYSRLCTKGKMCYVVLRHEVAGVVFSLRELGIKAPQMLCANPIREGMVYVSMTDDNPFESRDGDHGTVRAQYPDAGQAWQPPQECQSIVTDAAEQPNHVQSPLATTVRILRREMTAPVRFSVDRGRGKCEVRFDQAFPGRFIHLMMWSAPSERGGGTNVEIETVVANGLVGPRYNPPAEIQVAASAEVKGHRTNTCDI